jgi:glycogen phosphorylase
MNGTRYTLEVQPRLPAQLQRLAELANDLFYSWDRSVRGLFYRLDSALWEACRHNPKLFLRRVSQERLQAATEDRIYMEDYRRILSSYDDYIQSPPNSPVQEVLGNDDLIAYFCAEFGFHESFQIYSGGLGILAGDHCKAASDLGVPFVGVGMLYRQGYFTQTIDGQGNQIAHYHPTNFNDLPVQPATDNGGREVHVHVDMAGRRVVLKVWRVQAGRISLYLLDSDLPENAEADRRITYQLYGGDINTRIQQEIVLGIGGVRALRAIGLQPTVWHINEGHAAFLILERCREFIANGLDFNAALEAAAANTVFTTHTPVPAGHDIFDHQLMQSYFSDFVKQLGVTMEEFLSIGSTPTNQGGFNQTALALRGSRFRNGVSRIHGSVAARMSAYAWPQVAHDENPMGYVTNGVHVPTFLAREWANMFDMRFGGGWRNELRNIDYWKQIDDIPAHSFWSLRQSLKSEMLEDVRKRAVFQYRRNGYSESLIDRLTEYLSPQGIDILTLGFARRFATYKRATLIFSDPARLARILSDPQRPAILIFAGKAHPHDIPAQTLIKTIHDYSLRPEFQGRIILLEGYDQALARRLVTGVDVWLNTPEYPLEASGTSGQKAGINGVLNLSVLDGWWGEGYDGENGWAITPHGPAYDANYRDKEEAQELLDTLEKQVAPLYYARNGHGHSEGWVKRSKASMRTLIPRYNSQRMVMEYVRRYYAHATKQLRVVSGKNYERAREIAAWRRKVEQNWPRARLRRLDTPKHEITAGSMLSIRVAAFLNGLSTDEVLMECIIGTENEHGEFIRQDTHVFTPAGTDASTGEVEFRLDIQPRLSGLQYYKIRIFPFHPCLSHRLEAGYVLWL